MRAGGRPGARVALQVWVNGITVSVQKAKHIDEGTYPKT